MFLPKKQIKTASVNERECDWLCRRSNFLLPFSSYPNALTSEQTMVMGHRDTQVFKEVLARSD